MFSDYRAAFIIMPFKIGQLYLYILFMKYINEPPLRQLFCQSQCKILLTYCHKEQKIRGRHLDRFGRFFNDFFHPAPHSVLRQMQSSALGKLSNSLVQHMAHQVIFLVLLNFSSCSHLPAPPPPPPLLSCTIYYLLSLCLPVPGLLISLYLLMPEKMLLVCHSVLRGADIFTNTIYLACCKPIDASISLLLFSVKVRSAFSSRTSYLFPVGCFVCLNLFSIKDK